MHMNYVCIVSLATSVVDNPAGGQDTFRAVYDPRAYSARTLVGGIVSGFFFSEAKP
jgi:hypothetical protein